LNLLNGFILERILLLLSMNPVLGEMKKMPRGIHNFSLCKQSWRFENKFEQEMAAYRNIWHDWGSEFQ